MLATVTLPEQERVAIDIKAAITEAGVDWVIENGDLALEYGLRTMVLVCLFGDGRYEPESDPAPAGGSRDVRGWWADTPGDRWGSKLWLLGKLTEDALAQAVAWAKAALEPLIQEGIAESVDVRAERLGISLLGVHVEIRRGAASTWQGAWEAETLSIEGVAEVRIVIL